MRLTLVAAALVGSLFLAGCSDGGLNPSVKGDTTQPTPASFSQFSDVPIPSGANLDVDRTLILGQGENWLGRLQYSVRWTNAGKMYDFYRAEMPSFGWQELTSVRASISVQTWQRGDRIATVQIEDTTFGASVILTMAPGSGAGQGVVVAPQPAGSAPPPAVSTQPLK